MQAKEVDPVDVLHRNGGHGRGRRPRRGGRIGLAGAQGIGERGMPGGAGKLDEQAVFVACALLAGDVVAQDLDEQAPARGLGQVGRGARAVGDDVTQAHESGGGKRVARHTLVYLGWDESRHDTALLYRPSPHVR